MGGAPRHGVGVGREHRGELPQLSAVEFGTAPFSRHFGPLEQDVPQAGGQVEGANAPHLPPAVNGKQVPKLIERPLGVGRAAPTDEQRAAMVRRGQDPGAEGRESQHTRSTHALACEEQRSAGANFRVAQAEADLVHAHAREGGQRRRVESQTEKRGAGGFDAMAQRFPRRERFGARETAAGHRHVVEVRIGHVGAVPIDETKRAVGRGGDRVHLTVRAPLHTAALQSREQRIDHGGRLLRSGENAPFGLDAQRHAERFPQRHEAFGRRGAEQAAHQPRAARIDVGRFGHVGEGVGHIAATATRGAHLGERGTAAFEDHNAFVRQKFVETEGQHAAGCAAPEEGCGHVGEEKERGRKKKRKVTREEEKTGAFGAKCAAFRAKHPRFSHSAVGRR